MKNKNLISPVGLKGREVNNRILGLMNINESVEETRNSVVELTKKGPDGKAYAIVRENHEYYIKIADKTEGLVFEDFQYIGGLKNKKEFAFESYAKATKQLNLKFKSLNEAYGISENINALLDDNLLEHHPMNPNAKLSATKGVGDADEYVVDKKGEKLDYDASEDKETSGTNATKKKVKNDTTKVKVDMSENELAIDRMITNEESIKENIDWENPQKQDRKIMKMFGDTIYSAVRHDGNTIIQGNPNEFMPKAEELGIMDYLEPMEHWGARIYTDHLPMYKKGLSISRAIDEMDEIVESVYGSDKVDDLLENLSESEKEALFNALKKKA
jgi:hypothetical protein